MRIMDRRLEAELVSEFRKLPPSEQDEVVKTLKQIVETMPAMKPAMQVAVKNAVNEFNPMQHITYSNPMPLDICKKATDPSPKQEKDKTMCLDYDSYDLTPAQRHLTARAFSIYNDKNQALELAFGLKDNPRPRTANQLVSAITSGKYIIRDNQADHQPYNVFDSFIWRDPSVKKDEAGYKAAEKLLNASRTAVDDQIFVSDAATALKAVQDFEAAPLPMTSPTAPAA